MTETVKEIMKGLESREGWGGGRVSRNGSCRNSRANRQIPEELTEDDLIGTGA